MVVLLVLALIADLAVIAVAGGMLRRDQRRAEAGRRIPERRKKLIAVVVTAELVLAGIVIGLVLV